MAVNEIINCAIQDYYDLLGSMGHLNPNEPKNLFIATMLDDYVSFADEHQGLFTEQEIKCLKNMLKQAISNSCILSKKILC